MPRSAFQRNRLIPFWRNPLDKHTQTGGNGRYLSHPAVNLLIISVWSIACVTGSTGIVIFAYRWCQRSVISWWAAGHRALWRHVRWRHRQSGEKERQHLSTSGTRWRTESCLRLTVKLATHRIHTCRISSSSAASAATQLCHSRRRLKFQKLEQLQPWPTYTEWAKKNELFLGERYQVTFGLWHKLSVCLSSVPLLHSRQNTWTFRQYFAQPNINPGLGQFVLKSWAKIRMVSRESCKLNTRELAFFNQYLALIRKRYNIWP